MANISEQQRWYSTAEIEAVSAFSTLRTLADRHGWDMHLIDKGIVLISPNAVYAESFDCEYDLEAVDRALAWLQDKV